MNVPTAPAPAPVQGSSLAPYTAANGDKVLPDQPGRPVRHDRARGLTRAHRTSSGVSDTSYKERRYSATAPVSAGGPGAAPIRGSQR